MKGDFKMCKGRKRAYYLGYRKSNLLNTLWVILIGLALVGCQGTLWPKKKPLLVTPSTSEDCLNLGTYQNDQGEYVPVTMSIKKKSDCTVELVDIYFFANDPACESSTTCKLGTPGCKLLGTILADADPNQNYCMALEGSDCNECVQNEEGSPQEYWYWNNGQLVYSCFDLAAPPFYRCPQECYDNAGCP